MTGNEEKGLIFNIQRYSLNDGGGIRTVVFFKGCPLRCPWCSNPESQSFRPEKMKSGINGKITTTGKWYTVNEIVKEVLKDEVFFNVSGGGVTLSGGEILAQGEFATKLLRELKDNMINTAIETCGYGKTEILKKMLDYTDTVFFDLKITDNEKSKEIIKGDFTTIKENFIEATKKNKVIPRFPYIPKYTDNIQNIDEILKIISEYGIKEIHILPYHNYGMSKYEMLGRKYELENIEIPEKEEIEKIKKYVENRGFKVLIGG
ncbi:glycyl-radical enzyme activating protein [Leptotrichia sp. OH3620_COT-345]|uniref:glycyl-radical enzyme activating protein n=1 Tax=Leptotrichia sp. OH3620_COT-345 TaxID=2491048 RepID=UPI000F64BDB9|nr:glycyl-radical enzyme activating protein [Leptotrichia sp. OH3620_COT-345]RRD39911.1 glycyl-radical enzyme activating protein [Leptotrichia sp. OH3620_COT-345]